MKTIILEKRTVNNLTAILASVKLYDQPFRKTYQKDISRKRRRGGVKTGYFIYIFSDDNCGVFEKSFGFRILTYRKAKKFFEICYAYAKNAQLNDGHIFPLWESCLCNSRIFESRSHIGMINFFGNKDHFPGFYDFLVENKFIQTDKQN